ncbi:MAG TPA: transporter [Longimicrobium sp.]|nr:transporter [Longimicrobium sp.]
MNALLSLRGVARAAIVLAAGACATANPPAARPAPVASSRVGMTKTTATVAPGMVQLEAGYSRARLDQRTRHAFGETLVRIGVAPRTELRASLSSYTRTITPTGTLEGLGDASAGIKHRLRDPDGWVPAVGIIASTTLPTGHDGISAGGLQPEASALVEWKLPHGLRALGQGTWRDAVAAGDRYGLTQLSAAGRANLGRNGVAQLEYARVTSTRAGAAGVGHLRATGGLRLTPNLQLDGWAGRATTAGKHEYLFGVGFAQRW